MTVHTTVFVTPVVEHWLTEKCSVLQTRPGKGVFLVCVCVDIKLFHVLDLSLTDTIITCRPVHIILSRFLVCVQRVLRYLRSTIITMCASLYMYYYQCYVSLCLCPACVAISPSHDYIDVCKPIHVLRFLVCVQRVLRYLRRTIISMCASLYMCYVSLCLCTAYACFNLTWVVFQFIILGKRYL